MEKLSKPQKKDIRLIGKFAEVYCAGKHNKTERALFSLPESLGTRKLCPECSAFIAYAVTKRMKCPLEAEKPSCKHCRIHCYEKDKREIIRKIMAYSGRKLMMCGRLDYVWHYFF